jgi:hypothetical protein
MRFPGQGGDGVRRPFGKAMGLLLGAAIGACAVEAPEEDPVTRSLALLDAYAIAHGMAASYAHSPDAKPEVVAELQRLDARAALAALEMVHGRPGGGEEATARAVAALTDYAASQAGGL